MRRQRNKACIGKAGVASRPKDGSRMMFGTCEKTGRKTVARNAMITLGAIALCLLIGVQARAVQSVSLGWNPEPQVSGYVLYYGSASGNYSARLDVGTNLTTTVAGLAEGKTNYFVVTAYNGAGVEGPPSPEVSFLVPGLILSKMVTAGGKAMQLTFPVASGHTYQVEASTNLTSWAVIWTSGTTTSNAWTTFQDRLTNALRQRFYRLAMH
jgi:hypothetical protein